MIFEKKKRIKNKATFNNKIKLSNTEGRQLRQTENLLLPFSTLKINFKNIITQKFENELEINTLLVLTRVIS
jgi:hypothetical protein